MNDSRRRQQTRAAARSFAGLVVKVQMSIALSHFAHLEKNDVIQKR